MSYTLVVRGAFTDITSLANGGRSVEKASLPAGASVVVARGSAGRSDLHAVSFVLSGDKAPLADVS